MSSPKKRVPLLIAIGIGTYLPLLAAQDAQQIEPDSIPACVSVADDADGDGTGLTPSLFGEEACVITEQTAQHPLQVAIDGEVTRYTLQRNNWNPGQDLVNREIECTNYTWNSTSGSFDVEDIFTITHFPLAHDAPHLGEYEIRVTVDDEIRIGTGLWRSVDGRYVSTNHTSDNGTALKLHADPWGETIIFQNDQSGMRFWNMNSRDPQDNSVIVATATQECRYTSGDTFEPTGHLEEENSSDNVIYIGGPGTLVPWPTSVPEIINPQTGSFVPLRPLYYKLQRDLLQKQMWCTDYTWQDDAFIPVSTKPDGYLFMPPLRGEDRGNLYVDYQQQGTLEVYEWWTENTILHTTSGFVAETWQESTATNQDDFKLWHPDSNPVTYTECVPDAETVAQRTTPTVEFSEFAAITTDVIPTDEIPEETSTPIDESPNQQPIDELAEQNEQPIDETTEQSTSESDALPVSTENTPPSANTPAGNDTDGVANSGQTESAPLAETIQISGGGSMSLLMVLLVAGVRRLDRNWR
jgi:hypothetical protein